MRFRGRAALLGLAVAATLAAARPTAPGPSADSLEALRRAMAARPAPLTAEARQQRDALAAEGEARLRAGDARGAEDALDRAALIVHAAEVEHGLVRAYMQAGDYRRALAFGAHAAGAHRNVPAGMALYAWLLHVGGQGAVARRMLDESIALAPDDTTLRVASQALSGAWPQATGALAEAPLRLRPYPWPADTSGRVAGTAVLMADGTHALAPAALVPPGAVLRVRNGLGQGTGATVAERLEALGLVRLTLATPLPAPPVSPAAPRPPFPGSPGYTVEFAPSDSGDAAWPLLRRGFFGRGAPGQPLLGAATPPGPRGGPVFDAAGRLAGIAVAGADGGDRLVPLALLPPGLTGSGPPDAGAVAPAPVAMDSLYEAGLRIALQVIVVP